ncbi:Uncharacterised protein [Mycobacteroides abscessus subsp. abscessus]|nr:Uncharacterised protein [Mycobacteroides abscessus subsp. abscessus]
MHGVLHPLHPRGGGVGGEARSLQTLGNEARDANLVLDDQDGAHGDPSSSSPAGADAATHRERRPAARLAVDLQPSVVARDDGLDDAQAQPGPIGPVRGCPAAAEALPDADQVLLGDANALVGDPQVQLASGHSGAQGDGGLRLGVLHRIGGQLQPGLGDPGLVEPAFTGGHGGDAPRPGPERPGLLKGGVQQGGHVDPAGLDEVRAG